jgi:Mrp family chromosome partitioning ATPase
LALALGRERTSARLSEDAIALGAGVPVLAKLRLATPNSVGTVATSPPDGPVTLMFQEVRARVLAVAPPSRAVTVMATDDTGWASVVGLNLAESLASAGYSVVLVSAAADSTVERMLSLDPAPGLADVLLGEDLDQVTRTVNGLTVVPHGAATSRWTDLLAGRQYSETVQELRKDADYVVVIGGRASAPDALAAALPTDGVVLTASEAAVSSEVLESARHRVEALGVAVLGLVLVQGSRRRGWRRNPRGPAPVNNHHVRVSSQRPVREEQAAVGERESSLADQRR